MWHVECQNTGESPLSNQLILKTKTGKALRVVIQGENTLEVALAADIYKSWPVRVSRDGVRDQNFNLGPQNKARNPEFDFPAAELAAELATAFDGIHMMMGADYKNFVDHYKSRKLCTAT
jgi:hypothetical protein